MSNTDPTPLPETARPSGETVVQEWVPARETAFVATTVDAKHRSGWTLHSVTYGERFWTPLDDTQPHYEEGWLLLFVRAV